LARQISAEKNSPDIFDGKTTGSVGFNV